MRAEAAAGLLLCLCGSQRGAYVVVVNVRGDGGLRAEVLPPIVLASCKAVPVLSLHRQDSHVSLSLGAPVNYGSSVCV